MRFESRNGCTKTHSTYNSRYCCKVCNPEYYSTLSCPHGKVKKASSCPLCNPQFFCSHDGTTVKQKFKCKTCSPHNFCAHGFMKGNCGECLSVEYIQKTTRFCRVCCTKRVPQNLHRAGIYTCASCNNSAKTRTEVVVRNMLLEELGPDFTPPSAADNVLIAGCCSGRKYRPDLAWIAPDRAIFIEVDERGGHPEYESSCETARMTDIAEAVQSCGTTVPVVFLRLNPDSYDGPLTHLRDRVAQLALLVNEYTHRPVESFTDLLIDVHYLCYHSNCSKHVEYARTAGGFRIHEWPQKASEKVECAAPMVPADDS